MRCVSVIIPCYNSGATICKTVESIKKQTWRDVEIIVVDDGSTDRSTIEILDAMVGIHLVRQRNCGLPAARNAGLDVASGEFVLPLDADDWLDPKAIEAMVEALDKNPRAAFAYTNICLEGELTGKLEKSYNYFEQLFFNQIPYAIMMRRHVWEDSAGYDETMRTGYEDWEFNIRLGSLGQHGVVLPEPLLHYRVSGSGMLLSLSTKAHGELWARIQNKHRGLYQLRKLLFEWQKWRGTPSTYPLGMYFLWLIIHRALPKKLFGLLFKFLRTYSHARRVSRRTAC